MQPNYPNARPRRPVQPQKPPPRKRKKRFPWWTLAVIALSIGLLVSAYAYASGQMDSYDHFNQMRSTVSRDVIHGIVYIDDIQVSGMTMDEARAALSARREEKARDFKVTITSGDAQWRISSDDVPMEWNTESLLQKARMIGRVGSLEQRYRQITELETPAYLYSEFTYDKEAIRTITDAIASHLTEPAKDASVLAFNLSDRSFAISDEQVGKTVDANQLYQTVIYQLDNGQYGTVIEANVMDVMPAMTRTQLEHSYTRIASFTTDTTDNSNRNTNIDLAAQALNGRMLSPGESISFNATTGQRTRDKGYQEAGAIENGRTVQEVGGGVCQVSTTLFNALVRANCDIVQRKPHAWPSDYVPRGEDAAVDWPNLDLEMRNTSQGTLFIVAWYENRKITVEVYGLSLGDGVSIELESETTYSKKPTEVVYTYNGNLSVGTTQLLRKPRTGYSVQTYKIWLQNGVEVSREKLYTSEYRVINEEYEYNDGKPPAGS